MSIVFSASKGAVRPTNAGNTTTFCLTILSLILLSNISFAQDDDYQPATRGYNNTSGSSSYNASGNRGSAVTSAPLSTAATGIYDNRISSLEDQMRAMTGQIERLDHAVRRMDQAMQRMQSDVEMRLGKLETTTPTATTPPIAPVPPTASTTSDAAEIPNNDPEAAPTTPPTAEGTLGGLRVQSGRVVGGIKNPSAPPLPKTPADYGLTPQEQYDRAFGLLRTAEYDEAEKAFRGFMDKYPNDKLMENALYWYAETFYVRGKFQDSAVAFADAYQRNPKGGKAPDSLLKMAMALAAMDKIADACITLGDLKKKYPTAPATTRARIDQERARLKCGR